MSTRDFYCMADVRGECEVSAAPGDYVVIALAAATTGPHIREVVATLAPSAPRVTLRAGEMKTLEVVVPGR